MADAIRIEVACCCNCGEELSSRMCANPKCSARDQLQPVERGFEFNLKARGWERPAREITEKLLGFDYVIDETVSPDSVRLEFGPLSREGYIVPVRIEGQPISELFAGGNAFVIDDRGVERRVTGVLFTNGKMLISIDPSGKEPGQFEW